MFTRPRGPTSSSLTHRSTRPFVVAALCAAFVAAAPAAAQAQTVDDADTVADMAMFTYEGTGEEPVVPAPERTLNDVSNTTLKHGVNRVALEVDYVDLKKKAGGYQILAIPMVTNEGVRRRVFVDSRPGHWSGESAMEGGRHVRCSIRHAIDYEANVMKVSFPRGCISNPRWVKFRVVAAAIDDNDTVFVDDALLDRAMTDEDDWRYARSERVYRETTS